ncbi:two-component regulator propeller domain-containing protein [Chitinophaga sp. GCM10012297]|uniref:histidine kinase n=1 Tax=Chitinophaga chungangae TaxID=2821488 RepID=A0ABS3YAQ3_9BACT|nr:hybrid sensor histidine kinase/response regulator transcription factor [Chitinophaga chungangae]MBO9151753.1 response regulator [Chitinophaga chungangae]
MLLFASGASAQAGSMRFSHLGIADGLSQSSVYSIFQDSRGFIWIATTDGLNRYDGYNFRHFRYDPGNRYSINSNELLSIEEDRKGNLLVGTALGLDMFECRLERFHRILPDGDLPDNIQPAYNFKHVNVMKRDREGTVWVGTPRGLMRYDEEKRVLHPVDLGREPGKPYVRSMAFDADGLLWLTGLDSVYCYNPATGRRLPTPQGLMRNPLMGKSATQCIHVDSLGNIFLGTEKDGLIVWDRATGRTENYNSATTPRVSSDMVRAIYSHNGETWIGTRNGLYIMNAQRTAVRHFVTDKYDPYSISGNSILSIMKDKAGSMWVGSFAGGVSVEHPGNENFSYINEQMGRKPGLTYRVVSSIREDAERNLWIATEGGGVNVYDRRSDEFRHIRVSPAAPHHVNPEMVKALQFDGQGHLYIGTLEGLYRYDVGSGGIRPVPLKETPKSVSDEVIYGLAGNAQRLWVGTKGGLFRIEGGDTVRYRHNRNNPGSIISNDINALMQDSQGGVWIGTELGLSWLPAGSGRFRNYLAEYDSVFNKNAILCIYEDDRRNIWIGTRGGGLKLLNRERNQFFTLDTTFGLSSNIVHGIIQDQLGDLWVSFNQSIARIVLRKAHAPFDKQDVQVVNYSVNNGLGSNEFLAATCRTASGEVMFGGTNGIVSFNPGKLIINKTKPPVALTSFLIKNRPVAIGEKGSPLSESITYTEHITLRHDQAFFAIGFAALNYINPRTNQYAYILEGMKGNPQWNYVGSLQQASFTNLDAGEYVFKVKAANNDGLWNEQYTSLRITVLPPLWKTWYAYLFYLAVIAGVLYFFWNHSLKTARLRHELQMQQRSREKDQELAQRKLSFFTDISHEIKTPLTLILAPLEKLLSGDDAGEKVRHQLQLMQRNGERLLRLTDQLLDFRKFEAGHMKLQVARYDMVKFMREIILSFDAYARQRGIRLELDMLGQLMPLWFDHDKLEKIMFNLLSNAVKFTPPGGRIKVSVAVNGEGMVEINVEDNGAGIAAQHLGKIFNPFHHYNNTGQPISGTGIGLAFTKGLVTLHRGAITVKSEPAAEGKAGYTCFTVVFPPEAAQYAPEEMLRENPEMPPVEPLAASPAREESGADEAGQLPVMLIVEDNAEMLGFIASHFRDRYTVHEASDGNEGWRIATEVLPDIIISDVAMPGLNGTDLCRKLKKDERTCHIPVILLTARSPVIFQMEGLETGADDYITKPFNIGLLQLRAGNLLQSRALLRERYSKDITLQPANIAITSADETFLNKVMQFIDANILEPTLNVEQLARELNMSPITLYRKIKALTNQSTIEFIRVYRLKRGAQYLERNEFTVTEVAYMVGFSDVDYFRKCFKAEFGCTPKEYAAAKQGAVPE